MGLRSFIPNSLTSSNLLCGCAATVLALQGNLFLAAALIVVAAILDLLDGMAARALNASSTIGEQLDSLADMVSFGVAPGMLVFSMLLQVEDGHGWLPYAAFIIPLCSAFRLARFNAFKQEVSSFIGLATPANALFWALLVLVAAWQDGRLDGNATGFHLSAITGDVVFVLTLSIILSLLMVSKLPMFSFKLNDLSIKNNKPQFFFLLLCAVAMVLFHALGLVLIIPLYILSSVVAHLFRKA